MSVAPRIHPSLCPYESFKTNNQCLCCCCFLVVVACARAQTDNSLHRYQPTHRHPQKRIQHPIPFSTGSVFLLARLHTDTLPLPHPQPQLQPQPQHPRSKSTPLTPRYFFPPRSQWYGNRSDKRLPKDRFLDAFVKCSFPRRWFGGAVWCVLLVVSAMYLRLHCKLLDDWGAIIYVYSKCI